MSKIMLHQEKFKELKACWRDKWGHLSDNRKYENEEYRRIIKLGRRHPSILIDDLNPVDGNWFFALSKIAGDDDPLKGKDVVGFDAVAAVWRDWWRKQAVFGPHTRFQKVKEAAEKYGTPDFASELGMETIHNHESELLEKEERMKIIDGLRHLKEDYDKLVKFTLDSNTRA